MSDYDDFDDEFDHDHSPAPANLFGSPFPTNPGSHETFGGLPPTSPSPSDIMSPPPASYNSKPVVAATPSSPGEDDGGANTYDDEFDDVVEEEGGAATVQPIPVAAPGPTSAAALEAAEAGDDAHLSPLTVPPIIPTLEAPSQSTDQYGVTRVVSRPSSSGHVRTTPNPALNGALLQALHPTPPTVIPLLQGGAPSAATEGWKGGEGKEGKEGEYEEEEEYKEDFGGGAAATPTSVKGDGGGSREGTKVPPAVASQPPPSSKPLPSSSQGPYSTFAPTRSSSGGKVTPAAVSSSSAARKGSAQGGGASSTTTSTLSSKGGVTAPTLSSSSGSNTSRAQSLAKTVEARFGKRPPLPSGSSPVRVLDAQRLGLVEPLLTERTAAHNAASAGRMAAIESASSFPTPMLPKTTVVLGKEKGASRAALDVAASRAREAAQGEAHAKLTELREHYVGILVAKDKTIKSTNKKMDMMMEELEALRGKVAQEGGVGFKVSTLETLLREKDALIARLHDDNRQLAVISRSLEQQVSRLATEIALAPSRFQGLASELTVEREKSARAKAEEAARRAEDEARERKIEGGVGELVSGYRLLVAQIRRLGHTPTTPEPALVSSCVNGVFTLRDASNWTTNSVTLSPREHLHQQQLQHSLPQKLLSPSKASSSSSSKKAASGSLSHAGKQLLSPTAQARLKSAVSTYSGGGGGEGRMVVSPSGLGSLPRERGGDGGGAGAAAAVAAAVASGVAAAASLDTKGVGGGGKSRKSSTSTSAAPSRGASRGASRGGSRGAPGVGLGGSNKPLAKSLGSSRSGGGGGMSGASGASGLGVSPQSIARSAALEDRLAQLEARLAQQQMTLNSAIRSGSPTSSLTKEVVPPYSSSLGGEGGVPLDTHSGISPAKLTFSASSSSSSSSSSSLVYAPAPSAPSYESKESDAHQPPLTSPLPQVPVSNSSFTFTTMEDTSSSSTISTSGATSIGGGSWQRRTTPTAAVGVVQGGVVVDDSAGGGGKVVTPPTVAPAAAAANKPRARDPLLDDDDEDGGGGYAPSLGGPRFQPTSTKPTPRTDTLRQKYGGWGGLQNDSEEELEVETL